MPLFFNHNMVREEQDIPNWILDEFGRFTLKSVRTFFLEPGVSYDWVNSFYLHIFRLPNFSTLESFSWTASYKSSYSE